jgi:murein DD-endopeptidase MepM/ murein hydrolase activator NlpD
MENKIDYTTKELNAAIANYNQQDERMKKRINTMYKNGTSMGYLEIILSSDSFADFISRTDILKKIVDYDIETLKEMKQKREEIDEKKAGLEQDKAEQVAMKSSLDNKKSALVQQNKERKNLVALLSRQKSEYESSLKAEEEAAEKLKKEINALRTYKGSYDGSKWAILHKSDFTNYSPRITSYFGYRTDPITGVKSYHSGLDIGTGGVKNKPVYAMAAGKVIISRYYGGYGYAVVIDHGSGLTTLYGHNNTLLVKEGQTVEGGQKIALSGSTGRSTGPHVHFGVQMNGEYIDPQPYYMLGP